MLNKTEEKFYFSNHKSDDWSTDNNQMKMILVPKKWWSIKDWKLAKKFMKGLHIISMTELTQRKVGE